MKSVKRHVRGPLWAQENEHMFKCHQRVAQESLKKRRLEVREAQLDISPLPYNSSEDSEKWAAGFEVL